MMRREATRLWCVATLALAMCGGARFAAADASVDTATPELDEAVSLLQRLDMVQVSANYENMPLIEVAADLGARLPVKLRVDWEAINMAGIQPGRPITMHVTSASGTTALRGLAMMLGRDSTRAVVEAYGGQIVLTSSRGAAQLRFTAVYDMRDLLTRSEVMEMLRTGVDGPHLEPPPAAAPGDQRHVATDEQDKSVEHPASPANAEPGPDKANNAPPDAEEPPARVAEPEQPRPGRQPRNRGGRNLALERQRELLERLPPPPPAAPGERLVMLLTDHVDPDAWINFGGDRAEYSEREGRVFVTAPASTHRRLAAVLAQLRAAEPSGVTVEVAVIEVPRTTLTRLSALHHFTDPALARLLRNAADGTVLWQTTGTAAIDQTLTVDSALAIDPARAADGATVHFSMTPSRSADRNQLLIKIRAEMQSRDDRRMIETTAVIPPLPATTAVVAELPAAVTTGASPGAAPPAKLLIAIPRRF